MTPLALALAIALSGDPHTDVTLLCDGCFGMQVDLDGEHLLHLDGLGTASLQGNQLGVSHDAKLSNLPPGMHHLTVKLLQGPLDSQLAYDGQVFLRPGAKMVFRVRAGLLEDVTPREPPDAGAPPSQTSLVVRADDAALCVVVVDALPPLELRRERVGKSAPLTPGLHRVEVRSLQGAVLGGGSLFVGAGEEVVAGAHCQTGEFQVYSDPRAFRPDPPPAH